MLAHIETLDGICHNQIASDSDGKIIQNLDLIVKKDGSEVTFEKNGWDPFE